MSKTSILIRDMEMPASCIECRFGREVNYSGDFEEKCLANDKCGYVSVRKPRLDTCPLVEIKTPHGRLIDADKLSNQKYENIWTNRLIIDADDLDDAFTVIEAEGET